MQFWLVRRTAFERYTAAVVFTVAAALARGLMTPWLGSSVPFLTLYPALFFAALVGGGGPGVLSVILGAVISLVFWIPPDGALLPATLADGALVGVFVFTGVAMSYVAHVAWGFHLEILDSHGELIEQRRRAEQWVEQTQRGQRVIAAFSKSLTAGEIISVILEEAMAAVGAQGGVVLRVINDGRDLEVAQAQGMPAAVLQEWRCFSVATTDTASAYAVRKREAVYVENVADWARRFPNGLTLAREAGYEATAVLPFVVAGRALGALVLAFDTPRALDSQDRIFLERMAHQCAVALERVNVYEAEQRARLESERQRRRTEKLLAQSRRLQIVSASFSRTLTSNDVMRLMMAEGFEAIGASAVLITLFEEASQQLKTIHARSASERLMADWRVSTPDESPARMEVIRTNRPIYVHDREDWRARFPGPADVGAGSAMESFAMVPLTLHGHAVGVFGLVFPGPLPLDDDDRLFLESLGHYSSIALERAGAYDAERGARLEAEETNRLKDAFLATVSHELRTPLNAILGWAELLRRDVLPPDKRQRAVQAITDNAKRQAELTGDLLDMSRIIAGKVRLDLVPTDLSALIHQAVDVVQPAAEAKHLEVIVRADRVGPRSCDPGRMQQVLWNLLSNAVKFTPEHGRVEVSLTGTPACVEIAVRDSGEGIPTAFLPHVFEPFRQGDDTVTRSRGGLGLGLSIVRHLVELHGGTVQAQSEGEGQGAVFTVKLPAVARPAAREEAPDPPRSARTSAEAPSLVAVRALVVENEPDSREAMAIALRSFGADVLTAGTAAEARTLIERQDVQVLLVDIGLPGEDGYALLRDIRTRGDRHAAIPAAAITAYARPEDRSDAANAGFEMHLVKPVDGTTLARAVAQLMARSPEAARDLEVER